MMTLRKDKAICLQCKKIFAYDYSNKGKFCSNKCQAALRQEKIVEQWKENKIKGHTVGGKIRVAVKTYLLNKCGNKCIECGWNKINTYSQKSPLVVDHIDGNYENSIEENLRIVCPNCDSLSRTYKGLNRGNGRHSRRKRYHNGQSF